MPPLDGKVALVTGAAKRIGKAVALDLASAGAQVAITYLTSAAQAEQTAAEVAARGVCSRALRCDVRDMESVREALASTIAEFGRLDILVNNAGVYETVAFEQLTVGQWDNVFATNVRGPFLMAQQAAASLRQTRGRIVNLGSLGGLRPWATHAHYCASKAALIMLTKVMAKALAPEVAVNCVAPGMIDLGEEQSAEFFRRMAEKSPMQRNGSGEEVAAAVSFFATAPQFITGQVMAVDGGLELV
jgi:NAD(P)-dependent dehydrogenase (short-subunit alcohol dehydrogenase family)